MTLKSIFLKNVERDIDGVIKADDASKLRVEFEEYVLTREAEKRIQTFLDDYNNYSGSNGVWISGFFGSGKSHMLKMLSYLVENRTIDGTTALDLFLPKCDDNEILRGDLRRAASIPSKSVLFNIDQKSDVISKTERDALLAVFVKVFDEMCGYYGKQGYIAQFERDLDQRGQYEAFKSEYQELSGISWSDGREQSLLEESNISQAFQLISGQLATDTSNILDKYRSDYRVSIEDFANMVNDYIEKQPDGFRLNFFVDEVGQYIAGNINLMTNLQTIAESLATKCNGRSWIIVTAQEELDSVIGEMVGQQGYDFSKIQDRFDIRMKLTSANVDEVIQKRLLLKNDDGVRILSDFYHEQQNNFRTLFDFNDGSQNYNNFKDRDHFIHSYPFVPYQFALFQIAIQNLSKHKAFEGKHRSVGERSMLGVFQQVAIQISDQDAGKLATFDLMFEGIRTSLLASFQKAIQTAEQHLNHPFAVKVLKALFLVKYVKEFKATQRNICVLLTDRFNVDISDLRKRVEEALNILEQQTYIQRNGELYEYLTDEEKDVEEEIKNTEVDTSDVAAELDRLIFDQVLQQRKIRYEENGQDYPYSRRLDDRLHGREHELSIHVVSPLHEHFDKIDQLRTQSMLRSEVLIVLPPDDRLVRDLLMYKRTEKYVRQNTMAAQNETVKRIITDKGQQNTQRLSDLKQQVQRHLGKSRIFVQGNEITIASEDAYTRVAKAFGNLITHVYPNLRMLRGVSYSEDRIRAILSHRDQTLLGNDATPMSEAEGEMLAHIKGNSRGGVRTTLKSLIEKFEKKPNGWSYAAILCILAQLCARGKVEVRSDGQLLEDDALERAFRNSQTHAHILLDPQVDFTAAQIRALKDFYNDFFDEPTSSNEAKVIGKETGVQLQHTRDELRSMLAMSVQYPFLVSLKPVVDLLSDMTGKPYTWYLIELPRHFDELLDLKEQVVDPIRRFMAGAHKSIYDDAIAFVNDQKPNFGYVDRNSIDTLNRILTDPESYRGNAMQQVKTTVDLIRTSIADAHRAEIIKAQEALGSLRERIQSMDEYAKLGLEQQKELLKPFDMLTAEIEHTPLIALIHDRLRHFEDTAYRRILTQLSAMTQPSSQPSVMTEPIGSPKQHDPTDSAGAEPKIDRFEYVPARSIRVSYNKAWLADEADVDRYIESMRGALLDEIRKGKRIQI